jgi:hypothetical protein
MRPGDVVVGDRGFCSFDHPALLMKRQVHAVFRYPPTAERRFRAGSPPRPTGP